MHDSTNTTSVSTLGDHAHVSDLKLDERDDFATGDVYLDSVVGGDKGVRISDSTSIMGYNDRYLFQGEFLTLDSAELESLLFIADAMEDETTLGIEN
mmetsp:Transcript_6463/g.9766  ORF Transcript_6463/g.9766 Transcript_6463/m.9766 type:complete len:97 (+) Transcript_6463:267-557(+)